MPTGASCVLSGPLDQRLKGAFPPGWHVPDRSEGPVCGAPPMDRLISGSPPSPSPLPHGLRCQSLGGALCLRRSLHLAAGIGPMGPQKRICGAVEKRIRIAQAITVTMPIEAITLQPDVPLTSTGPLFAEPVLTPSLPKTVGRREVRPGKAKTIHCLVPRWVTRP